MTFFVYVFVNIGMVSGLLPVVGVPLPFISYWRNFAGDAAVSVWGFDVDPYPSQVDRAGLNKVKSFNASNAWLGDSITRHGSAW